MEAIVLPSRFDLCNFGYIKANVRILLRDADQTYLKTG